LASITVSACIPHWAICRPMFLNGKWQMNNLFWCPKKLDHYINKDLRVIDFSKFHRANKPTRREIINLPKEERTKLEVWFDIDTAFSEPITPNDKTSDYVPTQIIAEFFKTKGFDGIVYRSSLAKGFNVVLFDLRAADLISCQLAEVESVKFNFKYTNPFSYLIERD